ncbi:MAG TPA: hypothetical protein VHN19_05410 [Burkholderiales bacterium]|jgi:hypothetical protein|nr:hypothetical protein [Burkholderiales bacterium]
MDAGRPDDAKDAMLSPDQKTDRLAKRRLEEWTDRFAARLKANALWTKRFLHGDNNK